MALKDSELMNRSPQHRGRSDDTVKLRYVDGGFRRLSVAELEMLMLEDGSLRDSGLFVSNAFEPEDHSIW